MADSQRERQIEMVRRALNADLVEVVRCKDCKFWDECFTDPITSYQYGFCNNDKWRDVEGWEQETNGQDFCSYGKRKESNTVTAESAITALQEAAREFNASPDAFLGLQIGRTMDLGGEPK